MKTREKLKRLLCVLTAAVIAMSMFSTSALAAEEKEQRYPEEFDLILFLERKSIKKNFKSLSRNYWCADCAVKFCARRRRFDEAYLVYGEENRRSMAQNLQASGAPVILG